MKHLTKNVMGTEDTYRAAMEGRKERHDNTHREAKFLMDSNNISFGALSCDTVLGKMGTNFYSSQIGNQ